ncbi:MAG: UDP-N-acetylmuramoyl-L-alanine--D-glutamate ligase [Proteobacteria bacterium]|nr:UDP-N-acetylmuramoyl-L-alanine--D-glutamate ligase [Pseudomonadota bacterium]
MPKKKRFFQGLLIYGVGISGLAAARLAMKHHIAFHLWDDAFVKPHDHMDIPADIRSYASSIQQKNICLKDLWFMPSPGIPETTQTYQFAQKHCCGCVSELDFGWFFLPRPVIAVTGTNGKSTLTAMISYLSEHYGLKCPMLGNIGVAMSTAALSEHDTPWYVVELSSYQLASSQHISALASVMTGLGKDHLNRHQSLACYIQTKWRLISLYNNRCAIPPPFITTKAVMDIAHTHNLSAPLHRYCEVTAQEEDLLETLAITTLKEAAQAYYQRCYHPLANSTVRYDIKLKDAMMRVANMPVSAMKTVLKSFEGLPHRCSKHTFPYKGHIYTAIDDSKATNVEAVAYGLRRILVTYKPCYVAVILGGCPKKDQDFSLLTEHLKQICKVFIYGKACHDIAKSLTAVRDSVLSPSLKELMSPNGALAQWWRMHQQVVLVLSPGCESFGEYQNFAARGLAFQSYIKDILA